jgi:gamma-glutamylcyclotransferase (GGCT)/AIG2-like uncharacterized protein YtfP
MACWDDYEGLSAALSERFEEIPEYSTSTSDFPELMKHDSHYIFVYDGMKQGFRHDKHLLGCKLVAVGYTKYYFTMYREVIQSRYQQPVVLLGGGPKERAAIYGEVYQVFPEVIAELDWKESNGPIVTRRRVPVDATVSKDGTMKQLYPWMYIHKNTYWDSRFDRLQPMDQLTANSSGMKYYNFLKKFEQVTQ